MSENQIFRIKNHKNGTILYLLCNKKVFSCVSKAILRNVAVCEHESLICFFKTSFFDCLVIFPYLYTKSHSVRLKR